MGFSLSLLLILLFVRYVLPALLRAVLGGFVRQQVHRAQQAQPGRGFPPNPGSAGPPPAPGQVRVEYVPPPAPAERKNEFRGGEYVEYEEVK